MKRSVFLCTSLILLLLGCAAGEDNKTQTDPNAPVLGHIGDKSVQVGNNLNFTVTATDPKGETLAFSTDGTVGVGNPYTVSGPAAFDTTNHIFNWTPAASGVFTVKFTVTNKTGLTDSETITITVSSSGSGGGGTGQTLFSANCSSCHGLGKSQACVPWNASEITGAISSVGQMSGISLTTTQVNAIVDYVATAAPDC